MNNFHYEDVFMARGGKREGAGRKIGSTNRFSKQLLDKAKESGQLPLDFLLGVMRDSSTQLNYRMEAAKAAAPYVHHKLTSTSISLSSGDSHED